MTDLKVLLKKILVVYVVGKGTYYNRSSLERMKRLVWGKTPGQSSVK